MTTGPTPRAWTQLLSKAAADAFVLGLFLLVALGFYLCELPTPSSMLMHMDGKMVAGMAAVEDHPTHFQSDYVFKDPNNFRIYTPLYVQTIRFLGHAAHGDYYGATRTLLVPLVFLHLLGYYLLATRISRSRCFAILTTFALFGSRSLVVDTWGIQGSPSIISGLLFEVYFPFVLYVLLRPANIYRRPWFIGAWVGLGVWLHPVSAPGLVVGFVISLVALQAHKPALYPIRRAIAALAIVGALFGGYVGLYVLRHSPAAQDPSVAVLSMPPSAIYYPGTLFRSAAALLLADHGWPIIGTVFLLLAIAERSRTRTMAIILISMCSAYLLVSIPLCYVERTVFLGLGHAPPELDLHRGARYAMPLLLLAFGFAFKVRRPQGIWTRRALMGGSTVLVFYLALFHAFSDVFPALQQIRFVLTHGRAVAMQSSQYLTEHWRNEALAVLRAQTSSSAVVHCDSWDLCAEDIRARSLRSVYYAWTDFAPLVHSNHRLFVEWRRRMAIADQMRRRGNAGAVAYCEQLGREGVDFWLTGQRSLISGNALQKVGWRRVWSNRYFVILRCREAPMARSAQ